MYVARSGEPRWLASFVVVLISSWARAEEWTQIEEPLGRRWHNGRERDIARVTIVGRDVVFAESSIAARALDGRQDLAELRIRALRVTIDTALELPQTDLDVRASEVRFGPEGSIATTPIAHDDPLPIGRSGRPGGRAGHVTLVADRVVSEPGSIPLDLRGGRGQDAGPGADGAPHSSAVPAIERALESCEPCVRTVIAALWGDADFCPLPADVRERITRVDFATSSPLPRCVSSCGEVPKPGRDARPPGKAGDGGAGGVLRSNLALAALARLDGGDAGDAGRPIWHGSAAQAPREYYIAELSLAGCRFERYEARDGRDMHARPGASGNAGAFELIDAEPVVALEAFRRGDVDGDGNVVLTDPIALLQCLFLAGRCPDCADAADSNDDGALDLSDAVHSLGCLFLGHACPWLGACAPDETQDALDCARESCI